MAEIGKGFLGDICTKLGLPAWAVIGGGLLIWYYWLRKK